MATTAPSAFGPLPQFFDNNGLPLNGGLLFTYAAGTTNKTSTYTDETGATPNANPVVLNAAGRPNSGGLWVPPNVAFKFVLAPSGDTDPPTHSLWTVDQMTVALPLVFTGDSGSGGTTGLVPAPGAGFGAANYFLAANGTFEPLIVTPPASSVAFNQAGYLGCPVGNGGAAILADYPIVLADAGKAIISGTASPVNVTIPNDTNGGWTNGVVTVILIICPNGAGAISIVPGSGVTLLGPTAFTASGTRTLATNGEAVLKRINANSWTIAGPGIS